MAGFARTTKRQTGREKRARAAKERADYCAFLDGLREHRPQPAKSQATYIALRGGERRELQRIVAARMSGQAIVLRARIVLLAALGWSNHAIAKELKCDVKTVRKWRDRFAALRLVGLNEAPRDGRPPKFTPMQRHEILAKVLTSPPEGIAYWTLEEIKQAVVRDGIVKSISKESIARWLRMTELKPHRNKYWLNCKDPDFHAKMQVVVGHYVNPPTDGIVLCLDEKPGIQAKERCAPDKPTKPGLIRKIEFEYKRHGTATLMGSFNTHIGEVFGQCISNNDSSTFIKFVIELMDHYPEHRYGKLYLIMDNGSSHSSQETKTFLAKHKRLVPVYLPTHASWLNQIEVWFSVLSRKSLKNVSFTARYKLEKHITDFILHHNQYLKHPYRWSYKGQPLAVA